MTDQMMCEVCDDDPVTRWMTFEKGSNAGAHDCGGHEVAVCAGCGAWAERKGCPICFY